MKSDLRDKPEIFIPATPDYYATWVHAYVQSGGHVDDFRNGLPSDAQGMLYATEDFKLGGEQGSASRSIIVPEGVVHTGPIGHNTLYLFEGPRAVNAHSISAWATPEFAAFADLLEPDFKKIVRKDVQVAMESDDEGHWEEESLDSEARINNTLTFYGQIAVKLGLEIPDL